MRKGVKKSRQVTEAKMDAATRFRLKNYQQQSSTNTFDGGMSRSTIYSKPKPSAQPSVFNNHKRDS